jgi:DNA-binding NarL/FixJ family response regulator
MACKPNNERVDDKQAKLLVVDDYPLARERLKQIIDEDSALVLCGETSHTDHALEVIPALRPDLVIIDLGLGNSSSLDLIAELQAKHPRIKVLVLSASHEPFYAERVFRAGAQGCVAKQEPTENVLHAIRCVLEGQYYLPEGILRQFMREAVAPPPASPDPVLGLLRGLSARELHVFDLIGQGYGTRAIAAKLRVDPPTVRTFRARIKKKMRLNERDELLQAAVKWQQARPAAAR